MTFTHEAHGDSTVHELQEWVAGEVNSAGDTVGLESWGMLLESEERWPATEQRIFERSFSPHCPCEAEGEYAATVKVELVSDLLQSDTQALAEQISNSWVLAGWDITQISAGYFRADRADGAKMTIEGTDRPAGKRIALSVQSPCSADSSFTV